MTSGHRAMTLCDTTFVHSLGNQSYEWKWLTDRRRGWWPFPGGKVWGNWVWVCCGRDGPGFQARITAQSPLFCSRKNRMLGLSWRRAVPYRTYRKSRRGKAGFPGSSVSVSSVWTAHRCRRLWPWTCVPITPHHLGRNWIFFLNTLEALTPVFAESHLKPYLLLSWELPVSQKFFCRTTQIHLKWNKLKLCVWKPGGEYGWFVMREGY